MAGLYLKQLQLGPMQNFVYLIGDQDKHRAIVVDPAWDVDAILRTLAEDGMTLDAVFVTHYHPDHAGGEFMGLNIHGVATLLEKNEKIKVHVHKTEADYLPRVCGVSKSDMVYRESGDEILVGEQKVKFLHTPGHTPGSQCFLVGGNLIAGDTLFIGSCGRVDLPDSNAEQMYDSLNNKLRSLPDETVVYPGHDYGGRPTSTIGAEKRHNMFMRFDRMEDFLRMMGH